MQGSVPKQADDHVTCIRGNKINTIQEKQALAFSGFSKIATYAIFFSHFSDENNSEPLALNCCLFTRLIKLSYLICHHRGRIGERLKKPAREL